MRFLAWVLRVALFFAALGFAITNTDPVVLRFFGLDVSWRAPLVVFLLIFFVAGAALGLLGVLPSLYRQRREIGRLKREIKLSAKTLQPPVAPMPPDVAPVSPGPQVPGTPPTLGV